MRPGPPKKSNARAATGKAKRGVAPKLETKPGVGAKTKTKTKPGVGAKTKTKTKTKLHVGAKTKTKTKPRVEPKAKGKRGGPRVGAGRPRSLENERAALAVQQLMTSFDQEPGHAQLVVALLTFDRTAVEWLATEAAGGEIATLPAELRQLREVLNAMGAATRGELESTDGETTVMGNVSLAGMGLSWNAPATADEYEDEMIAKLDGAPVGRTSRTVEVRGSAHKRARWLKGFRSHLRRIEKASANCSLRWWKAAKRWLALINGGAVNPDDGPISHPGWGEHGPWDRETRRPGSPCECPAIATPHRHCQACGVATPDQDDAAGVRPVAHVHLFTFERRHIGYFCVDHARTVLSPYPSDWIESMRAARLFVSKGETIRVRLPGRLRDGRSIADLDDFHDAGPLVLVPNTPQANDIGGDPIG